MIAGLGLFGSFCTSKNFGNIGLESGCSYRCGTPEVEPLLPDSCPAKGVTLHGKVDAPEEASLPWGVQDVQKDEKEKSKTIHG